MLRNSQNSVQNEEKKHGSSFDWVPTRLSFLSQVQFTN